jgi:DNA-binding MarR family transcriptional regulator
MVENGFIVQERSTHDRRSIRVKLTTKGLDLCNRMESMFDKQLTALSGGMSQEEMANASNVYRRLERFLISMLDYGIRSQGQGMF